MRHLLALFSALLYFLVGTQAQQPPPPPPPPPPPKKAPTEEVAKPPPPPDMHVEAGRRLKELEDAKVSHYVRGAWLYGDYKHDHPAKDVVECSKQCEADDGCYHWNYHVMHHRCQLKAYGGHYNDDKTDWVMGHSTRYKPPEEMKEKKTDL